MKESYKPIADGVRVYILDDNKGTVMYTLQYRAFGRWQDTNAPVTRFYNVPI